MSKEIIVEDDYMLDSMEALRDKLIGSDSGEEAAKLGEAIAKMYAAKSQKKEYEAKLQAAENEQKQIRQANWVEPLKVLGTVLAAALGAAATMWVAGKRSESHLRGIDAVARYEKEDDIIFTGKTFGEIEKL